MGTKYSSNSTSGYNSVPPSDDGSVTEANKVKYSTIKGKLSDPVKTLADAINAELVTHFDNGPTAVTTNTTLGATHYNKVIQVSGSGVTLTLTDAATLTAGWYCDVVSTDTSNNVALARATASNTINETSADTTVYPLQSIKIMVNAAANGFLVEQKIRHVNGTLSGTIAGTPTVSGAWTFNTGQIFQNAAAAETRIHIRSGAAGQQASLSFGDGAAEKWVWFKTTTNACSLYDNAATATAISQAPNGTLSLAYGAMTINSSGIMDSGTVPLARMGSVVASGTIVVNGNSIGTIAVGTNKASNTFYKFAATIDIAYGTYADYVYEGAGVSGTETVLPQVHVTIKRLRAGSGSISDNSLHVANGDTNNTRIVYKVYELIET